MYYDVFLKRCLYQRLINNVWGMYHTILYIHFSDNMHVKLLNTRKPLVILVNFIIQNSQLKKPKGKQIHISINKAKRDVC